MVKPVCIEECRAHLECRVRRIDYPGDHGVICADIVYACYDDDAFGGTCSLTPGIFARSFICRM